MYNSSSIVTVRIGKHDRATVVPLAGSRSIAGDYAVKDKWVLIVVMCICASAVALRSEEPSQTKPPAESPALPGGGETQINSPKDASDIAATVGDVKITNEKIDSILQNLPSDMPQKEKKSMRNQVLNELIFAELSHVYLKANHVNYTKKNLENVKKQISKMAAKQKMTARQLMEKARLTEENLQDQARSKNLIEEITSPQKLADFIRTHPSCFNGTKIQARHILITCEPLASTKKQKTAKAKLEKIAAKIKDGKLKFEDAARMYSTCPSKEKGGMLPEFLFTDMLSPFSLAAFETDAGKMSGITRTKFGFHLIKVIGRTEGKEKPDPEKAKEIAWGVLYAELQNKLFDQALKTVPIIIPNENPQTRPEAKATAGKPNEKK